MEKYDEGTYRQRFDYLLQTPDNICKLMSLSTLKWTGSGTNWTFSEDYSAYVSKEKVFESIDQVITAPVFSALSQELKETMAAFVLWNKDEEVDADERASLLQVQKLLNIWKHAKR